MSNKYLIILLMVFTLFACRQKQKKEQTDTLTSGIISIAVDETFENIVNSQIDVFSYLYQEAFVIPRFLSDKEAIRQLIDDSVKIAITGRDLDDYEKNMLPQNRIVRKHPFGYEGIAFVVNRQNPDTVLSYADIKKILLGEINSWKTINKKSNLDTIKIFFQTKQNGVMRYLADSVTKQTANVSKNMYVISEGENIFDKVASNPNYIAVIGFNHIGNLNSKKYVENAAKVKILRVSKNNLNLKDSFLPYAGDVYNGDYPFWRPIYVLISETREGLPKGFCFFLTQQIGQKIVLKAGLMPITDVHKTMTRWTE